MRVLLDTCCFLWLAFESGRITRKAANAINEQSNFLYLSDVSVWEICMKYTSGRLSLPLPPAEWLPSRMEFYGLGTLPIEQSTIVGTTSLPKVHLDPFDRLIVSQAIDKDLTILSPDKPLSQLGARRIW